MDRAGEILVDRVIQVEGPTDRLVTVYRGVERESYSCMPICQRRGTPRAGESNFKSTTHYAGLPSDPARGMAPAQAYLPRQSPVKPLLRSKSSVPTASSGRKT